MYALNDITALDFSRVLADAIAKRTTHNWLTRIKPVGIPISAAAIG